MSVWGMFRVGSRWRHASGRLYEVVGLTRYWEDGGFVDAVNYCDAYARSVMDSASLSEFLTDWYLEPERQSGS